MPGCGEAKFEEDKAAWVIRPMGVSSNVRLMGHRVQSAAVSGFRGFLVSKTRLNVLCLICPLVLFNPRHEPESIIVTAGRLRPRQHQRPGTSTSTRRPCPGRMREGKHLHGYLSMK